MSERCLMIAAKNQLVTSLNTALTPQVIDHRHVEIMADERPKPMAGKMFWALHSGNSRGSADGTLDELYGLTVTISLRVNEPFDRIGPELLAELTKGMDDLTELTRVALNMNYTAMNGANTLILALYSGSETVYGFHHPLRLINRGDPTFVGADHFSAKPGGKYLGMKRDMIFGEARRLQPLGNQR